MWAFARQDLRLSAEEFYALTPRQFHAMADRHQQGREHQELLFAQLTSWVAYTGFKSTKERIPERQFMPSQWGSAAPKRRKKRRRSRAAIADEIRATMANFLAK